MHRGTPATLIEPVIHGAEVVLRKLVRLLRDSSSTATDPGYHSRDLTDGGGENLINLPGIVERIASYYEQDAQERSVHLHVDVAPDALVIGNLTDLHCVVEQLIVSALEEAPEGGYVAVLGSVEEGSVHLSFQSDTLGALLHPNASGSPEKPIETLSGLSMCPSHVQRVIRAHGGRTDITRSADGGLRINIQLPIVH